MSLILPPRELADGKLLIDEPAEGVVRLTISNPSKRNALDHPILDAITATLGELAPWDAAAGETSRHGGEGGVRRPLRGDHGGARDVLRGL